MERDSKTWPLAREVKSFINNQPSTAIHLRGVLRTKIQILKILSKVRLNTLDQVSEGTIERRCDLFQNRPPRSVRSVYE